MSIRDSIDRAVAAKVEKNPLAPGGKGAVVKAHSVWESAPVVGQIADLGTTVAVLSRGGRELNPIMREMIDRGGMGALTALKIGLGVGAAVAVHSLDKMGHRKLAKAVSIVSTTLGLGAAVNNARELVKKQ